MSKKYKDVDSKQIETYIKKFMKVLSCVDISDEIAYDDVMAFDCKIQSNRVFIAIYDGINTRFTNLNETPLMENEIENIIGNMVDKFEEELLTKYDLDDMTLDYQLYTFFDYVEDIKFILTIDFSKRDRKHRINIRKNIVDTQLMGKSKYLN